MAKVYSLLNDFTGFTVAALKLLNAKAMTTIVNDSPTDDITNEKRLLPKIFRVLMLFNLSGTIAKKKLM